MLDKKKQNTLTPYTLLQVPYLEFKKAWWHLNRYISNITYKNNTAWPKIRDQQKLRSNYFACQIKPLILFTDYSNKTLQIFSNVLLFKIICQIIHVQWVKAGKKKCFYAVFKAQFAEDTQRAVSRNGASTSSRLTCPRVLRSCFCFSGERPLCWSLETRENIHAHVSPLIILLTLFNLMLCTAKKKKITHQETGIILENISAKEGPM